MKNKEQTNACYGCFGAANGDCDECDRTRRKWAESEYVEHPVISKKDKAFLEYLREEYKYIARDKNDILYAYKSEPLKKGAY